MPEVLDLREQLSQEQQSDFDVPESSFSDTLVSWNASVHSQSAHRNTIIAGLTLLVAGVAVLVITKDWILTMLLILSGSSLLFHNKKQHPPLAMGVSEQGIHINDRTYFYRDLASFWVEYHPGGLKELSLGLRHWYLPHIKLPLGEQSPIEIRQALVTFLPEREHQSSLLDVLIKRIF